MVQETEFGGWLLYAALSELEFLLQNFEGILYMQ